jgi:hypothetical protein
MDSEISRSPISERRLRHFAGQQTPTVTNALHNTGEGVVRTRTRQARARNSRRQNPLSPVAAIPKQIRRTVALVVDDLGLSFARSPSSARQSLKKYVDQRCSRAIWSASLHWGRNGFVTAIHRQ